jgi:hypothetical protein
LESPKTLTQVNAEAAAHRLLRLAGGKIVEIDNLFWRAEQAISESQLLRDQWLRQRDELQQIISKLRDEIVALRREQQSVRSR